MSNRRRLKPFVEKAFLAIVLAFGWAGVATANIINYSISQGGWVGGGTMTGTFSGEDTNNDGFINLPDGEVNNYSVSFSGNSFVPSFTHDLADLFHFRYTIGSPGFRPSFPLYSNDGAYFYDADDYSIVRTDFSVWITTTENAVVNAVPEPPTSLLLVASAFAFIGIRKGRIGSRIKRVNA